MAITDQTKEDQEVDGEVLAVTGVVTKYGPNKQIAGKPEETVKQSKSRITEKQRKLIKLNQKIQKKGLDNFVAGL